MRESGGVLVRPATVDDLDVLVALARDAGDELAAQRGGARLLDELAPRIDQPAACRLAIDDHEVAVWCGCWEGFVVGYAVVRASGEGTDRRATITELFTGLATRELGIGDALVDASMNWARGESCAELDAYALPGARDAKNLFERSGLVTRKLVVSRRLDD